jgi:hypothetical protein
VLEAGCATALVAIVGIGPSSGAGGRSWPTGAAQVQSMGFYLLVEGLRLNMSVS